MADPLYQMTAEYVKVQDRIVFRVSTRKRIEYRVWLTRRLVKGLWGVAIKAFELEPEVAQQSHQPGVKKAVMSMRHQEAVQSGDFSRKHDTKTVKPPQIEQNHPLLAISAEIGRTDKDTIRLTFHTAERKKVSLNLTSEMLHAVCHLLQKATDKAGWDLKLSVGDAGSVVTNNAEQLH